MVVGLSNERMAEIESGLVEGEEVVVNPRVLLSDAEKAALGEVQPRGPGAPGGAGGKEKGKDKAGKKKA